MKTLMTVITERGQTAIPAQIRRQLNLKPGQKLRWQKAGDHECRVFQVLAEAPPGPLAMLGYARKLQPQESRTTDEWLRELREGEPP